MQIERNLILDNKSVRPILLDIFYLKNGIPKPIVIFAHGFKGFKDWGHYHIIAKKMAEAGFVFVKFNFSHNGTTPQQPEEFADLEAFGNNNLSIELNDFKQLTEWLCNSQKIIPEADLDKEKIYLLGHSRGGGTSIIYASEDPRIKKLVTWAAVSSFADRWPQEVMEQWKQDDVIYVENKRTNQQMPLYYQLMENFEANRERLTIKRAAENLNKPFKIIHGAFDESVSVDEARSLKEWAPEAEFLLIESANHTFGAYHPYKEEVLPEHSEQLVKATIDFLKKEHSYVNF
jgi:uncharacterized protein